MVAPTRRNHPGLREQFLFALAPIPHQERGICPKRGFFMPGSMPSHIPVTHITFAYSCALLSPLKPGGSQNWHPVFLVYHSGGAGSLGPHAENDAHPQQVEPDDQNSSSCVVHSALRGRNVFRGE